MRPFINLSMFLGLCAAFLISKCASIHVEFLGKGNPTINITATTGCENITKDSFEVNLSSCSIDGTPLGRFFVSGVCKTGAKLCLTSDLENETCFTLNIKMGNTWKSSKIYLRNITFFNEALIIYYPWEYQDNKSTLKINRIPGISSYKLKLELSSSQKAPSCSTGDGLENTYSHGLINNEDGRPHIVAFTADWSKSLVPGCIYAAKLEIKDDCDTLIYINQNVEDLHLWKPKAKKVTEDTATTYTWMISAIPTVFLVVLAIGLITSLLHLKRMQQRNPSPKDSAIQIEKESLPSSSLPTILLVYSPCLHQDMAALSTQLQNLTGLKIEDLYSVGDLDKINDPTVWLTRRLMDINIRFVLAVSTPSTSLTKNSCSENRKQGGVYHFLLDHFLQHLQSSKLAHDYTRVHHVRLENQPDNNLSNVTTGRLYLLPTHLNQLAINLTLPGPMLSIDKSSLSCKE